MILPYSKPRDAARLDRFLLRKGVRVVRIESECGHKWRAWKDIGLELAPFCGGLGLIWDSGTIVAVHSIPWSSILHEAGHILATDKRPSDEKDEIKFLGWEISVVKSIGLPMRDFLIGNADYGINFKSSAGLWYDEVRDFLRKKPGSVRDLREFLRSMVDEAKQAGVVSADGFPLVHQDRQYLVHDRMTLALSGAGV